MFDCSTENGCLSPAQKMFIQSNKDDKFLIPETLEYLDIKCVEINNKICNACLKYLRTVHNFLANYASTGSAFNVLLTMKKLAPASGSVENFSSIMDLCNANSLSSKNQNKVICESALDITIKNAVLYTPTKKQLEIVPNHATNSKNPHNRKVIRTSPSLYTSKFEQFISLFEVDALFLEKNKTNCLVAKKRDNTSSPISFKGKRNMKIHLSRYENGHRITCTLCNQNFFTRADSIVRLLTQRINEIQFHRTKSKNSFNPNDLFSTHSGDKQCQCPRCKKSCSYYQGNMKCDLGFHSNGEKPYQCHICEKSFKYNSHWYTHLRTHTNEKPYKCTICKTSFRQLAHLQSHLWVHSNEKPFQCNICNKSFNRKDNFKTHLLAHSNGKRYKCTICTKSFINCRNLNIHMRSHTNERPFQCAVCTKSFDYNSHLNAHMRTHTNEKPHQCSICNRVFSQFRTLKTHFMTHTNEKPYQCTICNRSFTQCGNLNSHLRSHTDEKPYQCTICKKSFSQGGTLTTHLRTHNNARPYQCTICEKAFNRKDILNTHIRSHTNEKPYQCTICTKYFSQSGHLAVHLRLHTNSRPYPCTICEKAFNRRGVLNAHLRSHTNKNS